MEKGRSPGLIERPDSRAVTVERGNYVYLFACAASHDARVSPVLRMFAGTLCIDMALIRYL